MRPEALIIRVDAAIQAAFAKQGRQPPADLLASTAGAAAYGAAESASAADVGAEEAGAAQAAAARAASGWQGLQKQQQALGRLTSASRHGWLHLPSAAAGAGATAGLLLLARSRRWLALLPGRQRHAPAAPGLFGKGG